MKGTHYKDKAAKARKNWNRLKEKDASESDLNDKISLQENELNSTSKKQKKDAKLRVAHKKLSNAS